MSYLTPADILGRCRAALTLWAEEEHARLVVCQNAFQPLDQLFNGPSGLLVALHWGGDDPEGEEFPGGPLQCAHRIVATVGHKVLLSASPGEALLSRPDGGEGLLDRMTAVQTLLLSLTFEPDACEGRLRYAGAKPVEYDGAPLSAYALTFALSAHGPCPVELDLEEQPE